MLKLVYHIIKISQFKVAIFDPAWENQTNMHKSVLTASIHVNKCKLSSSTAIYIVFIRCDSIFILTGMDISEANILVYVYLTLQCSRLRCIMWICGHWTVFVVQYLNPFSLVVMYVTSIKVLRLGPINYMLDNIASR